MIIKKILIFSLAIVLPIYIMSCGGVVGNIHKYDFPENTPESIINAIQTVYHRYPTLVPQDSTQYGIGKNDSFYFIAKKNSKLFLFECRVISPINGAGTELSLSSATEWSKVMKLASKMDYIERKKYKQIFEKEILPKIEKVLREELGKSNK